MPARTPAIGLLANVITLSDLQVTRDSLEGEYDAWLLEQDRTPRGTNGDYGAELEEARAEADFEFQAAMGELLDRGVFSRARDAGLAQGHLSAERAEQLTAEAIELASQAIGSELDDGAELERLMLALPVCGDGAERAAAADPNGFLRGLTQAIGSLADEPVLQAVMFPIPVHPLAWARLTVDQRYAFFLETQTGLDGPAGRALLDAHAEILDRASYPEDDANWAQVASPLRIWPVLVSVPLDPMRETSLEHRLICCEDSRDWGAWVKALGLRPPPLEAAPQTYPGQSWLGAPLPIQDILPVTAIDQLQLNQMRVTTPLSLVEADGVTTDSEHQDWRIFAFEDADGMPHPYALPQVWLGSTERQRQAAIERAFERWNGVGRDGLDAVAVPEPTPEPPRPPRGRPTLRVVR